MTTFASLGYRGQVGRLRRLGRAALAAWDLKPLELRLLVHLENTTFRVTGADGARYVLRIHRVIGSAAHPLRTLAEVRSEMEWLTAIGRDTELGVPEPVPRRNGELVTTIEVEDVPGPRLCVLTRWVPGRFVNARLTPRHLEAVGAFMAGLHRHARNFQPSDVFSRPRVADAAEAIEAETVNLVRQVLGDDDSAVVPAVFERVRHAERELGASPDVFGLIHADLHQANYLFAGDEVRAIDFDDCGFGYFVFDLAVTLSEVAWFPAYAQLREALLRGYREVRELSPDHERLIADFQVFRGLQLALWFIEQREHPGFPTWEREAREMMAVVREQHAGVGSDPQGARP
jgi:Ser/Thr protein kinase RdoA (MazF antagonist)